MAVALRVVQHEGLERLTMRRLAAELDTGAASLYVYVANTAELHGALLDELLGQLDLEPRTDANAWRSRLVDLLVSYTELLFGYPSLARSVLALRPSGPNYVRLIDAVLVLLRAGGVPPRRAAWGVDALLQLATATAAEQGTRDESVESHDEDEALARRLRDASSEQFPGVAWAGAELVSGAGSERLRWVFTALLEGIATSAASQ